MDCNDLKGHRKFVVVTDTNTQISVSRQYTTQHVIIGQTAAEPVLIIQHNTRYYNTKKKKKRRRYKTIRYIHNYTIHCSCFGLCVWGVGWGGE